MTFKAVIRWSPCEKMLRLFRWTWKHGLGAGAGGDNYDAKLSLAIQLKVQDLWVGVFWKSTNYDTTIWVCALPCLPLRIHYLRSYGGGLV